MRLVTANPFSVRSTKVQHTPWAVEKKQQKRQNHGPGKPLGRVQQPPRQQHYSMTLSNEGWQVKCRTRVTGQRRTGLAVGGRPLDFKGEPYPVTPPRRAWALTWSSIVLHPLFKGIYYTNFRGRRPGPPVGLLQRPGPEGQN